MRRGSTPPGNRTVDSGNSGSDCKVRAEVIVASSARYHPTTPHTCPMLFKILSLLLDVAAGLLGGACLLRLYMQYQRIPFRNPVGRFVFAMSDWLVLPLRKLLPAVG